MDKWKHTIWKEIIWINSLGNQFPKKEMYLMKGDEKQNGG